jgi:hypothetical protein
VAIIQISRIQVRRGKESQGTGVPRLASGELGWAVDTQRLYIGSGNTQEGAPFEGNVRILTANDNILNLNEQYYYKGFDEISNQPFESNVVGRSLQDRLDDFVSVRNFGVVGDGATDDTETLQFAINAISSVTPENRSVLYIPAGIYRIEQPLLIPPFTQIIGEGIENTVIFNNNGSVFETIGNAPINQIDIDTQPRHINISNLSIESKTNSSAIFLRSCRDSKFRNIGFLGSWFIPQVGGPTSANNSNYAIELESHSSVVTCKNNIFENIYIEKFAKAVFAPNKVINNTFKNVTFYELERGIEFGTLNTPDGPARNVFENCEFELIEKEGIQILSGEYNVSKNNKFINVGNDLGGTPIYPVIDFKSDSNVSINDYFDRTLLASSNEINAPLLNNLYVPEVSGRTTFANLFAVKTKIGFRSGFTDFIKIPMIDYGAVYIDYVYSIVDPADNTIINSVRQGTIEITINNSGPLGTLNPVLTDDFVIFGSNELQNLEFQTIITGNNTIVIQAKTALSLTDDFFYYNIKSKT